MRIMNGPAAVIGEQPSIYVTEFKLGKAEGSNDPKVRRPAKMYLWNLPGKGDA
ncbi:hypothetical protein BACCIP111895_03045 [Neobacillus rhizosphaerae]|uniref:Uncharacterized protein n=1 Tax=Neobacillus rhizosphaerae TaxID=2880965 RepID=A0ABN8KQA8_9BACI|nr:hypothetical protein BACCIP111895_03045 [Neobacillus rhizosphaerae]